MSETVWISPSSIDDVSLEEKEKMADRLVAQCKDGQNRLSELSSSADEKHKTDPSIFAPAELNSLQQHWAELLDKVWWDKFHLHLEPCQFNDCVSCELMIISRGSSS
jgi:hypothetical protein